MNSNAVVYKETVPLIFPIRYYTGQSQMPVSSYHVCFELECGTFSCSCSFFMHTIGPTTMYPGLPASALDNHTIGHFTG